MLRTICYLAVVISIALPSAALARGFGGGGGGGFHGGGGFGGGGFGGGGMDRGGFGGYGGGFDRGGFGGYGGFGGEVGGDRGFSSYGDRGLSGVGGYDRNFGGDFSADRFGGMGGDRYAGFDRSANLDRTANYNFDRGNVDRAANLDRPNVADRNIAGRNIGGDAASRDWQRAFSGTRAGEGNLSRFSQFNAANLNHVTRNWSQGDIANRATNIRHNFNYYHCFHGDWWRRYPGCWWPGWAGFFPWYWITWPVVIDWCGIVGQPAYYDYGNNIIIQNNDVYYDGNYVCTAPQYAQSATTLADAGQQANVTNTADDWKPLGVFALVQGSETSSNNLFQLAINKEGVIRGNYYDGLMDTTTPVYGSVDKKNQRAAWTIGKSNDRVFETGIYNLTKPQAPVLVHFGSDRTQQLLLVRMDQPKDEQQGASGGQPNASQQ